MTNDTTPRPCRECRSVNIHKISCLLNINFRDQKSSPVLDSEREVAPGPDDKCVYRLSANMFCDGVRRHHAERYPSHEFVEPPRPEVRQQQVCPECGGLGGAISRYGPPILRRLPDGRLQGWTVGGKKDCKGCNGTGFKPDAAVHSVEPAADDYFDDGCVHGAERDECKICTAAAPPEPVRRAAEKIIDKWRHRFTGSIPLDELEGIIAAELENK